MDFSRNFRGLGAHQHVDFAAHAKLGEVNAGLDRKAGVREDLPLVVDFKIVHVGAIRVNFGAD